MKPDIAFIPTPDDAIEALLSWIPLSDGDRLYDLGCGDGRLLLRAAQRYGLTGVGIDIDPAQIAIAQRAAQQAGVADRIRFRQENLFESAFQDATVVFVYLLPHLNLKLRPRLWAQLRPGARVISHQFDMGDWPPDDVFKLEPSEEDSTLYAFRIPPPMMWPHHS